MGDGEQVRPQNCKHGCESRIDIDIDIDPSRDNGIVYENTWFITIYPGSIT